MKYPLFTCSILEKNGFSSSIFILAFEIRNTKRKFLEIENP